MLDELESILGIEFKQDLNIARVNLLYREGAKKFRKDGETLHVNLASFEAEEQQEILGLAPAQFDLRGRVLRHDEEVEAEAIESGYDESLDEIRKYFDGVLSSNYHDILDRALYLRGLLNERDLTKDQIQERKGQIARRHGAHAIYLSSLVSAGYFDPDGGLRDLLVDMGLNPEYDKHRFQATLEEYVEKELLCVFVENDDDVYNVTQEVRGGLKRYQQEEPIQEWFDVRGIGDGCSEIINGVMANLEDEFIGIDYDRWKDGEQLWVRIYPRSLQPIS